jgi:hypothetical protein
MAVFICPKCQHKQAVDDKFIGRPANCPRCKSQGVVEHAINSPIQEASDPSEPTLRSRQQRKIHVPFSGDESSLVMEWVVIDDPRLPVKFTEPCGVAPSQDTERILDHGGGQYLCYRAHGAVQVSDCAVAAYEFRFLLFDIWGEHLRTLSGVEIRDLEKHSRYKDEYRWDLFDPTEGREYHASLGFIARVRTADARVLKADTAFVIREAQRFTERFTEADLDPQTPKND